MAKKKDIDEAQDELLDEAGDVRVYELGFHLDPDLPTEEVKKAYQGIREMVSAHGTIVAEGEPQMIQLAYTISKQETTGRHDYNSAYFCWIAYECLAANHAEVIAAAGANKRIIRFIDLVTTKDAARHAVEIREFTAKTQEPAEEQEAVADTELDAALQNVTL